MDTCNPALIPALCGNLQYLTFQPWPYEHIMERKCPEAWSLCRMP